MAARPIKFTEWSKSGKKHPLPIDLSTENKKVQRSAYEKERRPGRSFNRKWKDKMNKQMTDIKIKVCFCRQKRMSPPVPQTVVIGKKSIWVINKIKLQ